MTHHEPSFVLITVHVVTACSLLHTLLPPWEAFSDFPRVQKYYKLAVYIIGYIALNGRSTVYKSLSTSDGTKASKAANGANGGTTATPQP